MTGEGADGAWVVSSLVMSAEAALSSGSASLSFWLRNMARPLDLGEGAGPNLRGLAGRLAKLCTGTWGFFLDSTGACLIGGAGSSASECFFCWLRNMDHPLDLAGKEEETEGVGEWDSMGLRAFVFTCGLGGAETAREVSMKNPTQISYYRKIYTVHPWK